MEPCGAAGVLGVTPAGVCSNSLPATARARSRISRSPFDGGWRERVASAISLAAEAVSIANRPARL